MRRIWIFAITGGPCGGKTSCLPIIKAFFEAKGFKVIIVPEAATIVKNQMGINPGDCTEHDFQTFILKIMLLLEKHAMEYASQLQQDVIILCDRGIMDNKAYMSYDGFLKILEEHNLTEEEALSRYDAAFHMLTTANGAEKAYECKGARDETPEEARARDKKTQEAWSSHPVHHIIDNSTAFDPKVYRLIWRILEIVL